MVGTNVQCHLQNVCLIIERIVTTLMRCCTTLSTSKKKSHHSHSLAPPPQVKRYSCVKVAGDVRRLLVGWGRGGRERARESEREREEKGDEGRYTPTPPFTLQLRVAPLSGSDRHFGHVSHAHSPRACVRQSRSPRPPTPLSDRKVSRSSFTIPYNYRDSSEFETMLGAYRSASMRWPLGTAFGPCLVKGTISDMVAQGVWWVLMVARSLTLLCCIPCV
jgi:hypothetical protein